MLVYPAGRMCASPAIRLVLTQMPQSVFNIVHMKGTMSTGGRLRSADLTRRYSAVARRPTATTYRASLRPAGPTASSPSCSSVLDRPAARSFATVHRGAEAVAFSVYPADAMARFQRWCTEEAPMLAAPTVISQKAVYLPFWSFEANIVGKDIAFGRTAWMGKLEKPYAQVYAGHAYPRDIVTVAKCRPFWARPFQPDMLELPSPSGGIVTVDVQPYETYEATAWQMVRVAALADLEKDTIAYDPKDIKFTDVVSRRILMPAYEITYSWWGENLQCIVNGATGEAYGLQQALAGNTLMKILQKIRELGAGSNINIKLDPAKLPVYIELLRRIGVDPRVLGPLGGLLAGVLRPFVKLLFWPPFLVGSLLAFGGFMASQVVQPIAKHRQTFAQWEATRTAERHMQATMTDDWQFRPGGAGKDSGTYETGGSRGYSSSSSSYQQQQRQQQQSSYQSSQSSQSSQRSSTSSSSSSSSSYQQQQQQQRAKAQAQAKPKGRIPPPVNEDDHYAVLGVPKTADTAAVQAAFRRELLKYHPDHAEAAGWDTTAASDRTRIIIKSYGILRDPNKRAVYDRSHR